MRLITLLALLYSGLLYPSDIVVQLEGKSKIGSFSNCTIDIFKTNAIKLIKADMFLGNVYLYQNDEFKEHENNADVFTSNGVCVPVNEKSESNILVNGNEKYIISVKGEIVPEKFDTQKGFLILDFEAERNWILWAFGLLGLMIFSLLIFLKFKRKKINTKDSIDEYLETLKRAQSRDDFEYLFINKGKLDRDLQEKYQNLWNVLDKKLYKKDLNQEELTQIIQIKEQLYLENGRLP